MTHTPSKNSLKKKHLVEQIRMKKILKEAGFNIKKMHDSFGQPIVYFNDGMVRFQFGKDDSGVTLYRFHKLASFATLDFSRIDRRIFVRIHLNGNYNPRRAKLLFQKNPAWKKSKFKPVFKKREENIPPIIFTLKNADFSVESISITTKEFIDQVLLILDNIEPVVRLKKCSKCGHYLSGTIQE